MNREEIRKRTRQYRNAKLIHGVCKTEGCKNQGKGGYYTGGVCKICGFDIKPLREPKKRLHEEEDKA